MGDVRPQPLPAHALLTRYSDSGAYADCFVADAAPGISQADYVAAFYTTWLFKLERVVLLLVAKPSTDEQALQLACGQSDRFAAWSVEAREPEQLLVSDYQGKTRSGLMCQPAIEDGVAVTRLYFGTGIVPVIDRSTGRPKMSLFFRALLPFHKVYARALLRAARARLSRRR